MCIIDAEGLADFQTQMCIHTVEALQLMLPLWNRITEDVTSNTYNLIVVTITGLLIS